MNLWVLGSGETISLYRDKVKKLKDKTTLVLQRCFPHIYTGYGIIPTYWTWSDPYGSLEGIKYLSSLGKKELSKFKKMKILVPSHCYSTLEKFRKYSGSTPIERIQIAGSWTIAWENYICLLNELKERGMNIEVVETTTTKYIKNNPASAPSLENKQWLEKDCEERFKLDKIVFGTCKFDSESVIGLENIWGLENKLSSVMFPISQKLGAKNIFVLGFDHIGGRFYEVEPSGQKRNLAGSAESGVRHPWNDETQKKELSEGAKIPLGMVKKWVDWQHIHGMKIYNVVENSYTLLNDVLEYKKFDEALEGF